MKAVVLCILAGIALATGCIKQVPPKPPVPVVEISPIEGRWQTRSGERLHEMIFKPGGELQFQGGLEFFNPGQWDWDPIHKQLTINLPNATDKKLEIFQLYVGKGIQSFNPAHKEITYRFDETTSVLNVAGWEYTKLSTKKPDLAPEPTLR